MSVFGILSFINSFQTSMCLSSLWKAPLVLGTRYRSLCVSSDLRLLPTKLTSSIINIITALIILLYYINYAWCQLSHSLLMLPCKLIQLVTFNWKADGHHQIILFALRCHKGKLLGIAPWQFKKVKEYENGSKSLLILIYFCTKQLFQFDLLPGGIPVHIWQLFVQCLFIHLAFEMQSPFCAQS